MPTIVVFSGTGTTHPSGAPEFVPAFCVDGDDQSLVFCVCSVLWNFRCLSVLFLLVIVLSVLIFKVEETACSLRTRNISDR